MLRFFRQIRQRLLTDNKFSKYLPYAVGEILLVVIGILIAIQVDNWNDNRIAAEETQLLFQEVSDELVLNIKNIDRVLNLYLRKDTLYFDVLNKNLKPEDYKANGEMFRLPFIWHRASLVDEDFKALLSGKNNLTEQQDSIFTDLKDLYATRKPNTDDHDQIIQEVHLNFRDKIANEQPWWSVLAKSFVIPDELDDEIIQYALTDPFYLNQLAEIRLREGGHLKGMLWFRTKALNIYEKITEMLKMEKDTFLVIDITNFKHVEGLYQSGNVKRHISRENNLKLTEFQGDSLLFERGVHPYSKTYLISYGTEKEDNYLMKIELGEIGEVVGLTRVWDMTEVDGEKRLWKKIE